MPAYSMREPDCFSSLGVRDKKKGFTQKHSSPAERRLSADTTWLLMNPRALQENRFRRGLRRRGRSLRISGRGRSL